MNFSNTPIALAAAALWSALPAVAQTTVTIEAEGMALSSYTKESTRIRTSTNNQAGIATKKFTGTSGTYDMQVYVVPETDGQSTLEVYRGTALLRKYTYPLGSATTSFTVSDVPLKNGETLKLIGRPANGTKARVDKIVLKPVTAATPTEPTPAPTPAPAPSYTYSGTPYTGTPIAVPKAVEAVKFDKGGQNVAYKDLTSGNAGNVFRTGEDVDIVAANDADGGGYAINKFQTGEWLAYTLNVPANGTYDLAIKASNDLSTAGKFHIEIDGKDVTGPISVANTGGWNYYKWVGKPGVTLAAGKRVLKIVSDQQYFNLSAVSVLASGGTTTPTPTPTPANGVAFKLPAANATLSGTVGATGCEVQGTGIKSVQFSIGSTTLNADSASPWQCSIDTTKLANGTYTLKAAATYADGTQGSAQVAVSVQNGTQSGGTPTPTAKPASMLFWSEYEEAGLTAPFGCYNNGCWQELQGTERTGFSWPPKVYGSEQRSRFQLLVDGPSPTPSTIGDYMHNQIQSVTGRKGSGTKALYSEISKSGCCGTSPQDGSGVTQNPYLLYPTKEVPELYVSYWVKLQGDLASKMSMGTWRNLFEWKTTDTDRRVLLQILSYGGKPYWRAVLDQRVDPKKQIWTVENKSVPVPVGDWFKVEVYWKRSGGSDGRVWMAINGQVIADKSGSNMGPNNSPINRIFLSTLYTGSATPVYQWVDDLQIWSTFPAAKASDPWYNAPYAPR